MREGSDVHDEQPDPAPGKTADDVLSGAWRDHRAYLLDVAFRMLGSISDAEDVVQEAFSRLMSADTEAIADVRGWLMVVVGRLCLDQLRSAHTRRELSTDEIERDHRGLPDTRTPDPADRVTLEDTVRLALTVVFEQLTPPERVAFVLHDVFRFSFESVSSIVGRSPAACRQLASRARRRIAASTDPPRFAVDMGEQHRLAQRFIEACAGGDLEPLMQVLDPDVAGDVDFGDRRHAPRRAVGRHDVADGLLRRFGPRSGMTLVSQPVNGQPGVLAFHRRRLVSVLLLDERDGLVTHIHAIAGASHSAAWIRLH